MSNDLECSLTNTANDPSGFHVREVFRNVSEKLLNLQSERLAITRRIEATKKILLGLATMYANHIPREELQPMVGGMKVSRGKGLTAACRRVLVEAGGPLSAKEVVDRIRENDANLLKHHKLAISSVVTILNRLVSYGEAATTLIHNRRTWGSVGNLES